MSFLQYLLAALALTVLFLIGISRSLKKSFKVPAGQKLPPELKSMPIIGPALPFGKSPLTYATEQYNKHGDIFTVQIINHRLTFLVGPKAGYLFFKGDDSVLDQNEPYRFCVPIFGKGVVYDVPVNIRAQQLKLLSNSLKTDALRSYVPKIVKEVEDFFAAWPTSGSFDVRDTLSELIILTASASLMGPEVRSKLHKEVAHLYQKLDEVLLRRLNFPFSKGLTTLSLIWPDAPTPAHKKRDWAREEMVKLFAKVMKERRQNNFKGEDMLQTFMDFRYRDGRPTSDKEVAG